MKIWKVTLEGRTPSTGDDITLEFYDLDLNEIMKGYPGLKEAAIEVMRNNVQAQENYHAFENIKKIVGPDGKEVNVGSFIMFAAVDKNDLRFAFLLAYVRNAFYIFAIWPREFAEAVKENERIFWGVLMKMFEDPANWKTVDVILPVMLKK